MYSILSLCVLGLAVVLWVHNYIVAAKRPPLPPGESQNGRLLCLILFRLSGPKPLPFIGNLHQLSKIDQFKQYTEWARAYGWYYLTLRCDNC